MVETPQVIRTDESRTPVRILRTHTGRNHREELEESSEAGHAVSCSWQHMQPLVKQKAKVKAIPRKVRAKEMAR